MAHEKAPAFTEAQLDEFKNLSKPLLCFLRRYGSPHDTVVIDFDTAKIVSDFIGIPISEDE